MKNNINFIEGFLYAEIGSRVLMEFLNIKYKEDFEEYSEELLEQLEGQLLEEQINQRC